VPNGSSAAGHMFVKRRTFNVSVEPAVGRASAGGEIRGSRC
jgi:hypothetical protein